MAKDKSDIIMDALWSVQDGLKTIQAIQIQTAQAHQKFLETQSEATRILLELVKNTGRLAQAPAGGREELATAIAPAAFNRPAEPARMVTAAAARPVPHQSPSTRPQLFQHPRRFPDPVPPKPPLMPQHPPPQTAPWSQPCSPW